VVTVLQVRVLLDSVDIAVTVVGLGRSVATVIVGSSTLQLAVEVLEQVI